MGEGHVRGPKVARARSVGAILPGNHAGTGGVQAVAILLQVPLRSPMRLSSGLAVCIIAVGLWLASCGPAEESESYVARVHDATLSQEDVHQMIQRVGALQDSADVADQVISQWVRSELLYREAQRRGLHNTADVREQLRESERTILINALVAELHDADDIEPTEEEVQQYYDRHREQLRLREPYVQLRFAETRSEAAADSLQAALEDEALSDARWERLVQQLAIDPAGAIDLATHYHPERHVFPAREVLRARLQSIRPGEVARVSMNGSIALIRLEARADAGTVPERVWVEDVIRERLAVQKRKQSFARQVQRLHVEAASRDLLDVPDGVEQPPQP